MEMRLRGLDGPVEVARDRVGVPHCFAVSEHDAFFAQGFVHASDRLWQLDYDRRRGLGQAAEAIGAGGVPGDMFYRRVNLAASARRDLAGLSPAARSMLTAYSDGVNAAIVRLLAGTAGPSAEFSVTGLAPEPWEPWHSLLVYRVRHVTMGSASSKLWRAVVSQVLGPAAARQMTSGWPGSQLACVPPAARCEGAVPSWVGLDDGGSNNWALAGSRTDSGLPLLAGDPHRPLEAPNIYAQGHVSCPEWDVLGLAIPGVPGFPHFGHNARLAWCITHAMADDQDLYQCTADEQRPELIEVRGADPVSIDVRSSGRGPMICEDLAFSWAAVAEPNSGFNALPVMLRAKSVAELFEDMAPWVEPVNNLLAADRDGSIGYLTRGRVPIRSRTEAAWVPVPGDDPSYAWRGFVAFADMPRVQDPDGGFVFSANNRIQAADSGPYLGLDIAAPWRATRIAGTLSALSGATVEDMAALHRDVVSLPAIRIARLLADWAPLAGWDGEMRADSASAAAYSVLRRELAQLVMERSGLAAFADHPWNRLLPGIRAESVVWRVAGDHLEAGDESLLGGWTWRQALTEAIARAERAWHGEAWGELHATGQRHPLARPGFDPPSVPYGGDMDTVQAGSYLPLEGLRTVSASVARYAFDVADWDRSGWVVPLGAAGEPGALHAYNQQDAWRTGRLVPAPYSRRAVEEAAQERFTLLPV
ncbi:MAG TPA: penicillin acylase family protein [Streptosporangiaceae bacterium]|nr:penicillin acylase family protein [Streptosporangiaceae bacterium]